MANPPAAPPAGGGNFLTRHGVGSIPNWVTILGAAGILLGVAYWRNRNSSTSSTGTSGTSPTEPADQVPDYIFQDSTTINTPVTVSTGTPVPTQAGPPVVPPKGGTPPPSKPPTKTKPGTKATANWYTVKHGDTLSSIAAKNGTTWQALYAYNTNPKNRDPQAISEIKGRGPNLLVAGEKILIPPKG